MPLLIDRLDATGGQGWVTLHAWLYQRDTGRFLTDAVNWAPNGIGRLDLSHDYLRDVAASIGCSVKETPKPAAWYILGPDKKPPLITVLLDHGETWLAAIERYKTNIETTLAGQSGDPPDGAHRQPAGHG